MNIIKFYKDYNIQHLTEGHKHTRPGWVNTPCPFCTGNPGYHLGFNIEHEFYVCWRCGSHSVPAVIKELIDVSWREAFELVKIYGGKEIKRKEVKVHINTKPFKLPTNCKDIEDRHRKYLIKRNFNPDEIVRDWNILGTGMTSKLDNMDYKFRIIIPVMWNNEIVTFQGRDTTDKSPFKYLMCPEDREKINIKTILYGRQDKWTDLGIVVEGVTDVWRLGFNAIATFGIKYKLEQLREISRNFKRIIVLYDEDPQAQVQADKIVANMRFKSKDCFKYSIKGDPGSLSPDEALNLVSELKTYKVR